MLCSARFMQLGTSTGTQHNLQMWLSTFARIPVDSNPTTEARCPLKCNFSHRNRFGSVCWWRVHAYRAIDKLIESCSLLQALSHRIVKSSRRKTLIMFHKFGSRLQSNTKTTMTSHRACLLWSPVEVITIGLITLGLSVGRSIDPRLLSWTTIE